MLRKGNRVESLPNGDHCRMSSNKTLDGSFVVVGDMRAATKKIENNFHKGEECKKKEEKIIDFFSSDFGEILKSINSYEKYI